MRRSLLLAEHDEQAHPLQTLKNLEEILYPAAHAVKLLDLLDEFEAD